MRRVRPGEIQESVHNLLKRRQHPLPPPDPRHHPPPDSRHTADGDKDSGGEHKMPRVTRHSIRQMTLNRALVTESSTSNSVSYSSISGDVNSCDQQYAKLRRYINDAGQQYKSELCDLLYPIFIHVFLELVINGHRTPARKFFDTYHDQLVDQSHKERQRIIDTLRHTHMREDVMNNQLLVAFREHKYMIFMKSETLDYLLRYLKSQDNVVLMQVFNQYLSVQVKEASNRLEAPHDFNHSKPESSPDKRRTISGGNDVTAASLQKCIQRVKNCPPCVSSISFYTFINTNQGLCSCTISPDHKYLASGFENSAIKLWALTPELLSKRLNDDDDVSHLRLPDYDVSTDDDDVIRTSEMKTLRGHSGPVYGMKYMPDSKYLLSCSEDSTIRLWDMESFKNTVCYRGHNYPIWNLDISCVGYFATCSQDKSIRIWSTDRTFPQRTLVGHIMDVECLKFHPNGNYIASGSDDKTIRLWSVQEAKTVRLMQAHRSSIFALAFSPDGQQLASAGEDRRVRLWDLSSGQVVKELRGHTDIIHSLSYSQDGSMLASGGLDSTLRVWDVKKTPSASQSQSENTSPEMLASFPTKNTSVLYLDYARYNILHAAGGSPS